MSDSPYIGQVVYLDKGKRHAQRVIRVEDTIVWMIDIHAPISNSHKGNLYDENSGNPWRE